LPDSDITNMEVIQDRWKKEDYSQEDDKKREGADIGNVIVDRILPFLLNHLMVLHHVFWTPPAKSHWRRIDIELIAPKQRKYKNWFQKNLLFY